MLPADRRVRRPPDFARALRGRRAACPHLVLHLARVPEERPARVGFVVSRSVGGAVVRNRVQRRLRHLVKPWLRLLAPGSILVVRARPGAGQRSSASLGDELQVGLERLARVSR